MSDPGTSYRTRDEVQEIRQQRDPITNFRDRITTSQLATAQELKVGMLAVSYDQWLSESIKLQVIEGFSCVSNSSSDC